jgi:hypothetical protein
MQPSSHATVNLQQLRHLEEYGLLVRRDRSSWDLRQPKTTKYKSQAHTVGGDLIDLDS